MLRSCVLCRLQRSEPSSGEVARERSVRGYNKLAGIEGTVVAPPNILYKYRSLDAGSREHTLRTITHAEVWFSSLSEFNDPFEARVSVLMDGDDDAWRREFGFPRPTDDTIRRLIPELEGGIREDANKLGMLCFSAKPNDILMWSHYAQCHRGLCLGFRTTGDSILWDAQPVEYSADYPVIDYFRMTIEQRVRAMLLRKARHWEYEQEWRAIRTGPKPGIAGYPTVMLTSVILGSEISRADREAVLQAVGALPVSPDLYEARRSGATYGLDLNRAGVSTPSNESLQPISGAGVAR